MDHKVWLVTGAGRGMGVEIVQAALSAGHKVVATGRNTDSVSKATGVTENLLVLKLDITNANDALLAVEAAVQKFGTIDVLVNNAGSFYAGNFEELSAAQIQSQLDTNLIGPMNVTRAVLPVMRRQRSGHIISISSTAGIIGYEYCTAYAASKFGLEGWMESLSIEVAPFGIQTTIVEPGFFRTELLTEGSTFWAQNPISDYSERNEQLRPFWKSMDGKQGGDPSKLAKGLITIADQPQPPKRWVAGADAIAEVERKIEELQQQINAYRDLSSSLAIMETA